MVSSGAGQALVSTVRDLLDQISENCFLKKGCVTWH
jgi:hypothetical protein